MSNNQVVKPIVHFLGKPLFFQWHPDQPDEVAMVYAIDHPILGKQEVRTSSVIKKNDDTSFETLNTLYVPARLSTKKNHV